MALRLLFVVGVALQIESSAAGVVTVVDSTLTPVIDKAVAAEYGVLGGFETGNAFKTTDGMYHLIYGERAPPTTYPWKMGWTTQIGHWVSPNGTCCWKRLETVMAGASLWSTMPFFDESDEYWKIFYCNESVGDTRTAIAGTKGYDAIKTPTTWVYPECGRNDCPPSAHPSINTYSISNPFQPPKMNGNWTVFLDHGGLFAVRLAQGPHMQGPFELMSNVTSLFPMSPAKFPTNSTQNRTWIENPIVAQVKTSSGVAFTAMWNYVQGGGVSYGAPLPYLGFSWSRDGYNWPADQGELISVIPKGLRDGDAMWTDLVRTPTGLIDEGDGLYTLFYAARDTRNTTAPYTNCSVPPSSASSIDGDGLQHGDGVDVGDVDGVDVGNADGDGVDVSDVDGVDVGDVDGVDVSDVDGDAREVGGVTTNSRAAKPNVNSAPPPPPPGWSDGCFYGIGKLTIRLKL